MDSRKKILFIVHTEYHMMVTISLIADLYFEQDQYAVRVVQTIDKAKTRFRFSKNLSTFKHVVYEELEYDEGVFEYNQGVVRFLKSVQTTAIDTCVIFNKLSYLAFYVGKILSKSGSKLVLAPDGAAAYIRMSSFTPRWSFLVAYKTHKFLWSQKIRKFFLYWPTLKYGRSKEVQELWVQYPENVLNKTKKPIRKIDVLKSQRSIDVSKAFFDYTENDGYENCIFYANQPFRDERVNKMEVDFLRTIASRFPDRRLILKLHPTTFTAQKEKLKEIPGIQIVESTFPAEILIASLKNSIVASFWSTVMLVNNESCRFYWLYAMLDKAGIKVYKIDFGKSIQHINVVSDINEVV